MREIILKTPHKEFAAGEAFILKALPENTRKAGSSQEEKAAFFGAVTALKEELSTKDSEIYKAESLFLEDKAFLQSVETGIEEGKDATAAVTAACQALAEDLEGSVSDYLRGRSEDIKGLAGRLISLISGKDQKPLQPAILVAHELSPAQLSAIDPGLILGILTEKGTPTSHVAVLAGNMGVPYLYGEEVLSLISEGDKLILDSDKLIIKPDEGEYVKALDRTETLRKERSLKKETVPVDKCRIKIYANISGPEDIDSLLSSGAEGVGLFRSEFLFMNRPEAPDEEEQVRAYKKVAEAMEGKEVVIRTMDLGSDKTPDWLKLPEEKNPALGLRGIRVSLEREDLFKIQLRALLRAAVSGNIKIMLPMIASLWEVDKAKKMMEECAADLERKGLAFKIPPLGVMIETPAAVMIAEDLARSAAFFSIGTNDLTQYALAIDREGEGMEAFLDPCHEGVMRLIKMTADAAHKGGIPVAVCGELAANPDAIGRLLDAGIDELSVSPARVAEVRGLVSSGEKEVTKSLILAAPADGLMIPMEDIPDEAFSSGTLGRCIGILPDKGDIYAPCPGEISSVAETSHALTITTPAGDILVHAGIDTVKLNGRGMKVLVSEGERVETGQKIMEADIDLIRKEGYSPMIIVVECK